MLTDQDKQWLNENYSELKAKSNEISGRVSFVATYNEAINRFSIIREGIEDGVGGKRLSGDFNIRIAERKEIIFSRLPALYVEGVNPEADRHFNQMQNNNSACLCSPFEEDEYLKPQFNFQYYFEGLVIPFLYGQLFYSSEGRWPWPDYWHGSTGLLESYFKINDYSKAQDCAGQLAKQKEWQRVRWLLAQQRDPDNGLPCICGSGKKIRHCHPDALKGLLRLRFEAKLGKIKLA